MQALVIDTAKKSWQESRGFTLADLPMPVLDEAKDPADSASVIIKLRYAGVCGSDRGLWYRNAFKEPFTRALKAQNKTTRVVGHEFLGEIVEAGSMIKSLYADPDPQNLATVEVGTLVSGDSHIICGRCFQCRIGQNNVCMNEAILGITIDGVFTEYAKLPAKNLWGIDENRIRPEIAAMMDPFGNAVHCLSKVDVRGQRVAIFGAGAIGLFSTQLARNFGAAKVIVADIDAANLELAKKLGADEAILIKPKTKANNWQSDPEVIERIMELTYGKGVDVALEMAGPASSVNNALDATRRGGQVVLFGIKDGDFTIPEFSRLIMRGITIHAIIGRRIFETWQISQRVLSKQSNGIQDQIWNVILKGGQGTIIPLADFKPEVFEKRLAEHVKLIFKIGG